MFKARLKGSAFAMSYLSSAERVREQIGQLNVPRGREPAYIGTAGIKLSAARLTVRRYRKLSDYVRDMDHYVSQAADAKSQLIAFPELTGMLPVSLMPGFSAILSECRALAGDKEAFAQQFLSACETVQGFVSEIFLNTMSGLAKAHRIAVAAGSLYQTEAGAIYNRQYLFSDTGEVLGTQDKIFLSPFERQAGVSAGGRLTPVQTRFGRVAMVSVSDAAQYEPFLIASAMGCGIAVAGASPFGFDADCARYRAQEQMLCVLSPGLCGGSEFGFSFDIPAAIFAPRAATRAHDGVVARAGEGDTLTARVDLSRAALQFDHYTADKNPDFFRFLLEKKTNA